MIANAVLIALVIASNYFSFKAGRHKAMADMFGVLVDALKEVRNQEPPADAVDLARTIRKLVEARGL